MAPTLTGALQWVKHGPHSNRTPLTYMHVRHRKGLGLSAATCYGVLHWNPGPEHAPILPTAGLAMYPHAQTSPVPQNAFGD